MEKLIKFRMLSDSLSINEFESFTTRLVNQFDKRSIILTSLFHLFRAQNEKGEINSDLTTTISIISNIIQSRNSKRLKEIESKQELTKFTLHNLPSALIGECASFLPFNQYQVFQKTSRAIFIGCNNPISLQRIDKEIFMKH